MLALTDSMTRDVKIPASVFDGVRARLGVREIVELIATIAAYDMVSRFIEALEIHAHDERQTARSALYVHHGINGNKVEQLDNVCVAHPHAADRPRLPHLRRFRRPMDVDIPPHGVHIPQPVEPDLTSR